MPVYKTKILNQDIDLNYEAKDKDRLLKLIDNLNSHLDKFDNLKGRISDSKILILLALELEDKLSNLNGNKKAKSSINDNEISKLSAGLITEKDKNRILESKLNLKTDEFNEMAELLSEISNDVHEMSKSIISNYDD